MFDKEFYPTPLPVIQQMLFNVDIKDKTFGEFQAGKGDIVDYLIFNGAKQVIICEKNEDLAKIVSTKGTFLKNDFFDVQPEEISHIDCIIMNPPFSNADKHILHAWKIAPSGCEIISLCNMETLDNQYSYTRNELKEIIHKNGNSENINNAFSSAERKTNIDIALIKLYKPKSDDDFEFDGYFDLNEEYENQDNGIIRYNEIQEIVSRYVSAVKMFNTAMESANKINDLIEPINKTSDSITFGAYQNKNFIDRNTFKKQLQIKAWKSIFNKLDMNRFVTKSVYEEINKFVEKQSNVPFTLNNIYKMLDMIIGTHKGRMEKILVDTFDRICRCSNKNSSAGEKWKTNSDYKVNQKFIIPITLSSWSNSLHIGYYYEEDLNDILKAFCFISGKQFQGYKYVSESDLKKSYLGYKHNSDRHRIKYKQYKRLFDTDSVDFYLKQRECETGSWYQLNEFIKFKIYKKGTIHFQFTDLDVWNRFNTEVARIKGWALPKQTDKKQKGTERNKQNDIVIY